jgi:putative membrane protein
MKSLPEQSERFAQHSASTQQMKPLKVMKIALATMIFGLLCTTLTLAAEKATEVDRAFVAKVSQGGLFEVEAGKVAATHGVVLAANDFGALDNHDHQGVNSELKRIAAITGVSITPGLNAEFTQRLAKLKSIPSSEFDSYYLADMKQIHNNDEGLFVKEAEEGSAAYRPFAHQTAVLVKAHLGWLNTM